MEYMLTILKITLNPKIVGGEAHLTKRQAFLNKMEKLLVVKVGITRLNKTSSFCIRLTNQPGVSKLLSRNRLNLMIRSPRASTSPRKQLLLSVWTSLRLTLTLRKLKRVRLKSPCNISFLSWLTTPPRWNPVLSECISLSPGDLTSLAGRLMRTKCLSLFTLKESLETCLNTI